jgi:uncharacterized protein (AIM24 family)
LFFQSTKSGIFFAGSYGALEKHDLPKDKLFFVDANLFFAARDDTEYSVGILSCAACKSLFFVLFLFATSNLTSMPSVSGCCGGQGFVLKFKGPAVIFTRSRDPSIFNRRNAGGNNSGEDAKQSSAQG